MISEGILNTAVTWEEFENNLRLEYHTIKILIQEKLAHKFQNCVGNRCEIWRKQISGQHW